MPSGRLSVNAIREFSVLFGAGSARPNVTIGFQVGSSMMVRAQGREKSASSSVGMLEVEGWDFWT